MSNIICFVYAYTAGLNVWHLRNKSFRKTIFSIKTIFYFTYVVEPWQQMVEKAMVFPLLLASLRQHCYL